MEWDGVGWSGMEWDGVKKLIFFSFYIVDALS
jgi:hypothetical protein